METQQNSPRREQVFADFDLLKREKLLDREDGLVIGAIRPWYSDLLRWFGITVPSRLVTDPTESNLMAVMPPRTGKSKLLIANLLRYPGSALVSDPKEGELFFVTAQKRARFGRVMRFDPYQESHRVLCSRIARNASELGEMLTLFQRADAEVYALRDVLGEGWYDEPDYAPVRDGIYARMEARLLEMLSLKQKKSFEKFQPHFQLLYEAPVRINPLSALETGPQMSVMLEILADAVIVQQPGEQQPFFSMKSAVIFKTLAIFILSTQEKRYQNLGMLYHTFLDMCRGDESWKYWLNEMVNTPGIVSERSVELKSINPRELRSVQATMSNHIEFLANNYNRLALSANDFDIASIKRRVSSLYIILPTQAVRFASRLVRLILATAAIRIQSTSGKPKLPAVFFLDEYPSLGPMDKMLEILATLPATGLRCWLFIQSVKQLEALHPRSWESFLQLCSSQVYKGLSGSDAAQLSRALGQAWQRVSDTQDTSLSLADALFGREKQSRWAELAVLRPDQIRLSKSLFAVLQNLPAIQCDAVDYLSDNRFSGWLQNPQYVPVEAF